jgi:thioredoxin reductase (NADPH)
VLTVADLAAVPLLSCLATPELERLARTSADMRLQAGEYATHAGETRALYIVLDGRCEITKVIEGIERVIGTRGPNEEIGLVFGEASMALGMLQPASLRAAEPSRVVCIGPREFHIATAVSPELAERLGAAARERIEGLAEIAAEPEPPVVTIVGPHLDARGHELRRFLDSNAIGFEWIEPDDPVLERVWPDWRSAGHEFPTLRFEHGETAVRPSTREVADRLGLSTRPQHRAYDAVIIGGGPAGLAAAVYGASEGLRTIMIERQAPGGQAGTSSRIENYLGFPNGVSGDELATRALQQARRLGAEVLVTRQVANIDVATRRLTLDGGETIAAKAIVLATGVTWRRLTGEGFDRLAGKGVYYGASRSEAPSTQGLDVALIGAGNSAGQAALHFANFARKVTIVVRGDSLAKSMSHYLIEQLIRKANIEIRLQSEVTGVYGETRLERIDLADKAMGTTECSDCAALFVFIGADAETDWLPAQIARDARGYVLTGEQMTKAAEWPLERDPYLLETSVPGIFACGDVRFNSVKRVASGVGEGSMSIAFIHQYLAQTAAG